MFIKTQRISCKQTKLKFKKQQNEKKRSRPEVWRTAKRMEWPISRIGLTAKHNITAVTGKVL